MKVRDDISNFIFLEDEMKNANIIFISRGSHTEFWRIWCGIAERSSSANNNAIATELEHIYKEFNIIEDINMHWFPNNLIPHNAIGIKIEEDMAKTILDNLKKHFISFEICIEKTVIIENDIGKRYFGEFHLNY